MSEAFEPKKLALIRILQILRKYSDMDHHLTQEKISEYLQQEYGIFIERKAISRNLSLLKEAGYEIESDRNGSYLEEREFEDSELRMLIDGVLSSKYITAKHSKDLIEKLCAMSNKYFRSHVKNIYSVNDWSKTDNQALFYNIEIVDEAIEQGRQVRFDFNRYGLDKKLHRTKTHCVSPYQLILRNQRYYLMGRNEYWGNMGYYRLDHITNMELIDAPVTPVQQVEGFEGGIDYKTLSTALPYMFTDKPQRVEFIASKGMVDQIMEWFGSQPQFVELDDRKMKVSLYVSPTAMEYWAMQYVKYVEVTYPESLRQKIRENLEYGQKKYQ